MAGHAGDAYVKSFSSWSHLLALLYAQFSAAASLRSLEAGWNANRQHHYHLGNAALVRSTLCDANRRRPVAIFAETFSRLASQLDRQTRRDGAAMVKLIDSTPIRLGKLCAWASNRRELLTLPREWTRPERDVPRSECKFSRQIKGWTHRTHLASILFLYTPFSRLVVWVNCVHCVHRGEFTQVSRCQSGPVGSACVR